MKIYEIERLADSQPTSVEWGLVWCRMLAKETPSDGVFPAFSIEDEEWSGLLLATSKEVAGVRYYLPWEAVAVKLLTDPTWAMNVTEEGYSQAFRSPEDIANHLRGVVANSMSSLYPAEIASTMGSFVLTARF